LREAFVARLSVETEAKNTALKIIAIDKGLMVRPVGCLWREKSALSRALMQCIEQAAREAGYLKSWRPQGDSNPCIHRERVVS